ncbi:MAG: hypothetical protein KAT32_01265 [Candidatus Moranbacteria bacterium]|nr:hypothetical protein [Candidatus Moranbacteria bacterium]
MLNPDFPIIKGEFQMTKNWSINLPIDFNKRIEEGSLVIWKKDFTIWINVLGSEKFTKKEQINFVKNNISKDHYDFFEENESGLYRFKYKLDEFEDCLEVNTFVFGELGYVQMSFYYDNDKDTDIVNKIWRSVKENAHA